MFFCEMATDEWDDDKVEKQKVQFRSIFRNSTERTYLSEVFHSIPCVSMFRVGSNDQTWDS